MEQAFDARRVMLSEQHQSHSQWRTVSLVSALRGALLQDGGPAEDNSRMTWLRHIVDELTDRGIDGQSLIRLGMVPEITGTILIDVAIRRFGLDDPVDTAGLSRPNRLDGPTVEAWDAFITTPAEPLPAEDLTTAKITRLLLDGASTIFPWVASASLDSIFRLEAPTHAQPATDAPLPDVEVAQQYRWIVDRFAVTDLRDWAQSSLHLEYRWLAGQQPAPCRDDLMRDRSVPAADLNAEIAHRAVNESPIERTLRDMVPTLAVKMHQRALTLLKEGRTTEAAALFEFAVSQDPHDPAARNNLGFCLLTTHPRHALAHLQKAHALGYQPVAVNLYNRALCHILVQEHRTALSLITDFWTAAKDERAILWTWEDPEFTLAVEASSTRELALLAHRAAATIGDTATADRWADVIAGLDLDQ